VTEAEIFLSGVVASIVGGTIVMAVWTTQPARFTRRD
jgi:hypothetical protein